MAGAELRARVEALTAEVAAGAKTLAGAEAAAARATAEAEAAERRLAAEKDSAARTRLQLAEAKRRLARHEAIEAAKRKLARHKAIQEAKRKQARHKAIEAAKRKGVWRDWAGLPEDLLVKVAETLIAQTEAGWAASLKTHGHKLRRLSHVAVAAAFVSEDRIQKEMAKRKREGNCLFVFARVCTPWRKAQLTVGGPLRTRVKSDVLLPGSVALVKWALAEGCPRKGFSGNMADFAAMYGNRELVQLVQWLSQQKEFVIGW